MTDYKIAEITPQSFFTDVVYIDDSFIVVTPEMPFSDELSIILKRWNYKLVKCAGEPKSEYTMSLKGEESNDDGIKDTSLQSDSDKLEKAETFYKDSLYFLDNIFRKITGLNELNYTPVAEQVRNVIEYIKEDRRFLIRIISKIEPPNDKSYLTVHSVKTAILSIIMGTYLKLPNHRLIELGVAALLHDIGMLKLSPGVYLSNRKLTAQEHKAITTHPILGYSMLKNNDFPVSVGIAVLEHHERENGTGYPRNLISSKISLYAKIIAVASSYEALSSNRLYKEAKDGHIGMLELLKNEGRQYDDTIVRALVFCLSIYPIGLYVLLSNGKKGQVVDVNPETPKFPVVQVFGEFTPDGKIKVTQTAADNLFITRPLTKKEIDI